MLNPKTRLVDADISVPPGAVMSGEAFEASIQVGTLDGWVVPHDAVLTDGKGAYLFQVRSGKAVRVDVTPLGQTAQGDSVEGAIDPAAPVVVAGSYQLADGVAVRAGQPGG